MPLWLRPPKPPGWSAPPASFSYLLSVEGEPDPAAGKSDKEAPSDQGAQARASLVLRSQPHQGNGGSCMAIRLSSQDKVENFPQ